TVCSHSSHRLCHLLPQRKRMCNVQWPLQAYLAPPSSSGPKCIPMHSPLTAQVNLTLKATGLDYIDLMLVYAPFGGARRPKFTCRALVDAQEAGKVRSIEVSNYVLHHLNDLEVFIKELEAERGREKGGVI